MADHIDRDGTYSGISETDSLNCATQRRRPGMPPQRQMGCTSRGERSGTGGSSVTRVGVLVKTMVCPAVLLVPVPESSLILIQAKIPLDKMDTAYLDNRASNSEKPSQARPSTSINARRVSIVGAGVHDIAIPITNSHRTPLRHSCAKWIGVFFLVPHILADDVITLWGLR